MAVTTAAAGWATAYGGYAFVRYFRGDQLPALTLAARGVLALLGALALLVAVGIWWGRRESRLAGILLALPVLLVAIVWLWQIGRVYLVRTYAPPVLLLAASGLLLYALIREADWFRSGRGAVDGSPGDGADPRRSSHPQESEARTQPAESAGVAESSATATTGRDDPSELRVFGSTVATERARRLWSRVSPSLRVGAAAFGLTYLAQEWARLTAVAYQGDAYAYWSAGLGNPYDTALLGAREAYLYSPAFLQVLAPLELSWQEFYGLWTALNMLALVYVVGPLGAALAMLFFPPVGNEIATGNIHLMLAAAIVVGLRHPAAWSFVLLTKLTPAIGLLWFLLRGEWRRLGTALAATGAIAVVSYLLAPQLWAEWAQVLAANAGGVIHRPRGPWLPQPLPLRVAVAAALVAWGALANRPATLAVAAVLALPVVWGTSLAMLVAVVPLALREWRREEPEAAPYRAWLGRVAQRLRPRPAPAELAVTSPSTAPLLASPAGPGPAPGSAPGAANAHPPQRRLDRPPPAPGGRSEA